MGKNTIFNLWLWNQYVAIPIEISSSGKFWDRETQNNNELVWITLLITHWYAEAWLLPFTYTCSGISMKNYLLVSICEAVPEVSVRNSVNDIQNGPAARAKRWTLLVFPPFHWWFCGWSNEILYLRYKRFVWQVFLNFGMGNGSPKSNSGASGCFGVMNGWYITKRPFIWSV